MSHQREQKTSIDFCLSLIALVEAPQLNEIDETTLRLRCFYSAFTIIMVARYNTEWKTFMYFFLFHTFSLDNFCVV